MNNTLETEVRGPQGASPNETGHHEKPPSRMLQLDVLRGIAILLVLNFHLVIKPTTAGFLSPVANRLYRMGWTGVDLFFVLSGFLIGGLLFQEIKERGSLDVRQFLVRRAFKIWPSYYLFIVYLFVMLTFTSLLFKEGGTNSIIPNLLHFQNYTVPPRNHTWSLAVEEHFYLVLPFLIAGLYKMQNRGKKGLDLLPTIAIGVGVACLLLRVATSFKHPWAVSTHFTPTHLRIDSLFFGVLIAYFYHFKRESLDRLTSNRPFLLTAGLLLISPAAVFTFNGKFMSVIGFTLNYLGYGAILVSFISTPVGVGTAGRAFKSLPARAIAFIGVYSYPIYLWHIDFAQEPIRHVVNRWVMLALVPGPLRWLLVMATYIVVATLVGFIMGNLIEKPALKLRERLFPRRADLPVITSNASQTGEFS